MYLRRGAGYRRTTLFERQFTDPLALETCHVMCISDTIYLINTKGKVLVMCLGHYNEVMRFKQGINCIFFKKKNSVCSLMAHWHTVKTKNLDTGEYLFTKSTKNKVLYMPWNLGY